MCVYGCRQAFGGWMLAIGFEYTFDGWVLVIGFKYTFDGWVFFIVSWLGVCFVAINRHKMADGCFWVAMNMMAGGFFLVVYE